MANEGVTDISMSAGKTNLMKQIPMLAFLPALFANLHAAPISTNATSSSRSILIERSSTGVAGGTATLSIGQLDRNADLFTGGYEMKVSPYFFKSEKGKLAIVVPDESLAQIHNGMTTAITGTATTNGKGGKIRHIDAIATPLDRDRGALKLWFTSGEKKVIFNTSYHFTEIKNKALNSQ
jgi:hypothetical protein